MLIWSGNSDFVFIRYCAASNYKIIIPLADLLISNLVEIVIKGRTPQYLNHNNVILLDHGLNTIFK